MMNYFSAQYYITMTEQGHPPLSSNCKDIIIAVIMYRVAHWPPLPYATDGIKHRRRHHQAFRTPAKEVD
jgi:hypothetical protein